MTAPKHIYKCTIKDFEEIYRIINDAAIAYKGIIPSDRWQEPYMDEKHLKKEIAEGVEFWGYKIDGALVGVMGIQDRTDVCLIRHAYVKTSTRRSGVGTSLLNHLKSVTDKKILIGTWQAAGWAIKFYEKNGFMLVDSEEEKNELLKKYWNIPKRQIETSVVLKEN